MKSASRKPNFLNIGLIIAALAMIVVIIVFSIVASQDRWLTRSTVQRKALPADQCTQSHTWYLDETGQIIRAGEEVEIFSGMKYFYEKTGVQPFLWVAHIYDRLDECNSMQGREELRDQILAEKYEELFGSDGGHVLIAVSDIHGSQIYIWYCYPGETAKSQVMDDEASKILVECLSYMQENDFNHPGLSINKGFVKAADTIMTDQTFISYAVAIVIVAVLILIAIICISSIRRRGKENVAYHKTLKEREKARKEEAIADQKQAELEKVKFEAELETQYMAIPCPNCGGTGNKIRKGTVGICKFCGTAIKVGKDGKIEFLSNDD